MKKMNIKHTPLGVQIAMVFTVVVGMIAGAVIVVSLGLKDYEQDVATMAFGLGYGTIMVIVLYAVSSINTVVEYGEGDIIKCRWAFLKWEIDLSKAVYVIYTIESHYSRGGPRYTFNVEFIFSGEYGEERKCLKVYIDNEMMGRIMQGEKDDIPLMQLYRYAEERYPDKAAGFEKTE